MPEAMVELACCDVLVPEVRQVLERLGREDLRITSFPVTCHLPRAPTDAPLSKVAALLERDRDVIGFCFSCTCLPQLEAERAHQLRLLDGEIHGELFLGRDATERALAEGALVVLPGWLKRWRRVVIEDWGFDRTTARQFYGESNTGLLVLDTGVTGIDPRDLDSFADFCGLPVEVRFVGTSHLEAVLGLELERHDGRVREEELEQALARCRAAAAEQASIVDFVTGLAELHEEVEVVARLGQLAELLFAPQRVDWVPAEQGGAADDGPQGSRVSVVGGRSLHVEVRLLGRALGALRLGDVAVPAAIEGYRPMARTIADAGAVAICAARLLEEERALRAALAVKVEELDSFVSLVAHDLKQPLTVAMGYADLLQLEHSPPLSASARQLAALIVDTVGRMGQLIEDLLVLARVGREELPRERLSLSALVRDVLEDIDTRGADVRLEADVELSCCRRWAREALLNLLSNALKYNDADRPSVEVGCVGEESGEQGRAMAVIAVRDNGRGIADVEQERVFDLFRRLESSQGTGGSGLGLAIVKKAVEAESGRVWLESEPGRGSTFYMTLPRGDPAA